MEDPFLTVPDLFLAEGDPWVALTLLEADLAEGDPWMALEWSQTLLEADLELAPAPCLVDGPIASCCCLDLVLRTRQGRSPADF